MENYPFIPKSNKKIKVGDYWVMKLSDKSNSIGVIIDIPPDDLKLTREVIIGLLDWNKAKHPKESELKNCKILSQGHAHIKAINYSGKEILGNINFKKLNISPKIMIDTYGANSNDYYLMQGYKKIRKSDFKDDELYEMSGYWGYDYIKEIAENIFVKKDKNRL
ncbi:conserved hypothetical protein [Tenacibaculum litoreum]